MSVSRIISAVEYVFAKYDINISNPVVYDKNCSVLVRFRDDIGIYEAGTGSLTIDITYPEKDMDFILGSSLEYARVKIEDKLLRQIMKEIKIAIRSEGGLTS